METKREWNRILFCRKKIKIIKGCEENSYSKEKKCNEKLHI